MSVDGLIRDAVQDDLTRIVEIYNQAVPTRISTADTVPATVQERSAWFNKHSLTRPVKVFDLKGYVIGWMSFEDFYGRPAYHFTAELSIYVDKDFQGKGAGSELMNWAIEKSRDLGIRNLVGYVFSHNAVSVRLLKKYGFEKWGELPEIAEMDGKFYSLIIMGLKV